MHEKIQRALVPFSHLFSLLQFGSCRSVREFEKLNRIGEGTYGIVCKSFVLSIILPSY